MLEPLLAQTGTVDSAGAEIRWFAGGEGGPTLVLVHGGGAHSGWWEPMLAGLTARQRVVMLDLAGHGDSTHRPGGYPTDLWVQDVATVITEVVRAPAVVIGHSLGGRICSSLAGRHPELLTALMTVDAVVPSHDREPIPPVGTAKLYPSEEAARRAFRLMPPQPPLADAMTFDRLARRSYIRRDDGQFTWKWDPQIFGLMADRYDTSADVPEIICPVSLVLGGASDVTTPDTAEQFIALLGRPAEVITVPGAHHHVPLDSPAALDALIRKRFAPA